MPLQRNDDAFLLSCASSRSNAGQKLKMPKTNTKTCKPGLVRDNDQRDAVNVSTNYAPEIDAVNAALEMNVGVGIITTRRPRRRRTVAKLVRNGVAYVRGTFQLDPVTLRMVDEWPEDGKPSAQFQSIAGRLGMSTADLRHKLKHVMSDAWHRRRTFYVWWLTDLVRTNEPKPRHNGQITYL